MNTCQSHCNTCLLYSGSQYAGDYCTLKVTLVNVVSCIAVRDCCTQLLYVVAVRSCFTYLLYSGSSVSECCQLCCSTHLLYSSN